MRVRGLDLRLVAAITLAVPSFAHAQERPVTTSTTASLDGPAQQVNDEFRPEPPPTAQEIDAAKTPAEQRAAAARELEKFLGIVTSFRADVRAVIRLRFEERKNEILSSFDKQIGDLEGAERDRRLEAIERFEAFLKKYPDDPEYSPNAMFRLAELNFEKSSDEYLRESEAYERQLAEYESGRLQVEPKPPEPSYAATVALYEDLLKRFPKYQHVDAVHYLLGYSYGEMGKTQESLKQYAALADGYPDSQFLPEVLTRIGEIYFDMNDQGSIEKSIEAYARVLKFKDSPYYDKALYKLAWAYYRLDRFDEAVAHFIELVDYADSKQAKTGKTGSELRAEALQYIAISLADEKWGGLARAEQLLGRDLKTRPYVGEMWKRYGEILFDQTRYDKAIEVLMIARDRYPNAPYAPDVQGKIITAYERQRDFENATRAREMLVAKYDQGTPWYDANHSNGEALDRARELMERSVYTAAIYNHQQAQVYKQAGRHQDAVDSYRRAAVGYRTFLARFPKTKNAYDFTFYLAECYYYSGDLLPAAETYEQVRDSRADRKHLEASALSAVIAYEKEIERQEASGRLKRLEFQTAAKRGDRPVQPVEIADLRLDLVQASDRYIELLPNSDRSPAVAYRAAEVFYNHEHLEEARPRFEAIVTKYPGTEVARYSANLIIESYLASRDWDNVQKWSQKLIDVNRGSKAVSAKEADAQKKMLQDLQKFKVGAVFKKAEQLDSDGKFEDAANLYVQLVDENPNHEFADKALFNGAIAYEKVKRFDAASRTYQRIYENYPKSTLAPQALFRVGVSAEKTFDFPTAITAYNKLVANYPDNPKRADAMYNVAVTLENMQQYGDAAKAFRKYAETFPSREDAGDNFFRSATVYEKMKSYPEAIKTFEEFITRYGKQKRYNERVVEAYMHIGQANLVSNKPGARAFSQCIDEYRRRGIRATDKASRFAAECQFQIAEDMFRKYDAIKLVGTGKRQTAALLEKARVQRQVEEAYKKVFEFKRVESTLASSYRVGHSYERFAESLFSAEVPPEFKNNPEFADQYKLQLEDRAQVLERKAETAYRKAYEEAVRSKVTNEWTDRILEGLNKYKPDEFPMQKAGKSALQNYTITGHGLDALDGSLRSQTGPEAPKKHTEAAK